MVALVFAQKDGTCYTACPEGIYIFVPEDKFDFSGVCKFMTDDREIQFTSSPDIFHAGVTHYGKVKIYCSSPDLSFCLDNEDPPRRFIIDDGAENIYCVVIQKHT